MYDKNEEKCMTMYVKVRDLEKRELENTSTNCLFCSTPVLHGRRGSETTEKREPLDPHMKNDSSNFVARATNSFDKIRLVLESEHRISMCKESNTKHSARDS
jgi:hypothetical protein